MWRRCSIRWLYVRKANLWALVENGHLPCTPWTWILISIFWTVEKYIRDDLQKDNLSSKSSVWFGRVMDIKFSCYSTMALVHGGNPESRIWSFFVVDVGLRCTCRYEETLSRTHLSGPCKSRKPLVVQWRRENSFGSYRKCNRCKTKWPLRI